MMGVGEWENWRGKVEKTWDNTLTPDGEKQVALSLFSAVKASSVPREDKKRECVVQTEPWAEPFIYAGEGSCLMGTWDLAKLRVELSMREFPWYC